MDVIISLFEAVNPEAFVEAAGAGNLDKMKRMRDSGKIGLNEVDSDGRSALHMAVRNNHFDVVWFLLEAGAEANLCTNLSKSSPLHYCCEKESKATLEIAALLIMNDADINLQNDYGETALHYCSENGTMKIADILVKKNADVSLQNQDRRTALHNSCFLGHIDITRLLVTQLLRNKANISVQDKNRFTPLHDSCSRGHFEVIRYLVNNKADATLVSKDGRTPIDLALQYGHVQGDEYLEIFTPQNDVDDSQTDNNIEQPEPEPDPHIPDKYKAFAAAKRVVQKVEDVSGYSTQLHNVREDPSCSVIVDLDETKVEDVAGYSTRLHDVRENPQDASVDYDESNVNDIPGFNRQLSKALKEPGVVNDIDENKHDEMPQTLIFDELHATRQVTNSSHQSEWGFIYFEDITDIKKIGEGYFSYTFCAQLGGSCVVIKAPKSKPSKNEAKEFDILLKLPRCENVLALLGLCPDFSHELLEKSRLSVVVPYQKNRDLKSYLRTFGNMDDNLYLNVVLGMSRGIEHLHENTIIHRDIALRNFLVSDVRRVLVSDFGLSRMLQDESEDAVYHGGPDSKFPLRWCAPETLKWESSKMSDIWMFGVTILEMFEDPPFAGVPAQQVAVLTSKPDFVLQLPKECPTLLKTVAQCSCQHEPLKRPHIADIIDNLVGRKPLTSIQVEEVPGYSTQLHNVRVNPHEIADGGEDNVRPTKKDLENWTKGDVRMWVSSFGKEFEKHGEVFEDNGIDGETLMQDFEEAMQLVNVILHRNKLSRSFSKLRTNLE